MEAAKAESAPGFRSFWEKTKREEAHRNLTFVQVEDGGGSKRPRRRRGAGKTTADAEEHLVRPSSPIDEDRRQQVYQAQKRHRTRKKEYAKCLRIEKAELQQLLKKVKAETQQLLAENESIKAALSSSGFDLMEEVSIMSSITQETVDDGSKSVATKDGEPRRTPEDENNHDSSFSDAADPRVSECRTLLLKDIEVYRADEEQEKAAWDVAVSDILQRM